MVGEPPSSRMRPEMEVVGDGRVEMKYVDSMQPQEWPRRMYGGGRAVALRREWSSVVMAWIVGLLGEAWERPMPERS